MYSTLTAQMFYLESYNHKVPLGFLMRESRWCQPAAMNVHDRPFVSLCIWMHVVRREVAGSVCSLSVMRAYPRTRCKRQIQNTAYMRCEFVDILYGRLFVGYAHIWVLKMWFRKYCLLSSGHILQVSELNIKEGCSRTAKMVQNNIYFLFKYFYDL